MAEDKTAPAAAPAAGQAPAPSISIVGQYMRDLSFENPDAPKSIVANSASPTFGVNINVAVKKQDGDVYAVELALNAKAEREKGLLFSIELIYGGLFKIQNVPENQMAPVLMIECPRLIFPFARQIIANVTQSGGFPPLLMEPVDFTSIYRQNLTRMAAAAQQAGAAANGKDGAGDKDGDDKTVN